MTVSMNPGASALSVTDLDADGPSFDTGGELELAIGADIELVPSYEPLPRTPSSADELDLGTAGFGDPSEDFDSLLSLPGHVEERSPFSPDSEYDGGFELADDAGIEITPYLPTTDGPSFPAADHGIDTSRHDFAQLDLGHRWTMPPGTAPALTAFDVGDGRLLQVFRETLENTGAAKKGAGPWNFAKGIGIAAAALLGEVSGSGAEAKLLKARGAIPAHLSVRDFQFGTSALLEAGFTDEIVSGLSVEQRGAFLVEASALLQRKTYGDMSPEDYRLALQQLRNDAEGIVTKASEGEGENPVPERKIDDEENGIATPPSEQVRRVMIEEGKTRGEAEATVAGQIEFGEETNGGAASTSGDGGKDAGDDGVPSATGAEDGPSATGGKTPEEELDEFIVEKLLLDPNDFRAFDVKDRFRRGEFSTLEEAKDHVLDTYLSSIGPDDADEWARVQRLEFEQVVGTEQARDIYDRLQGADTSLEYDTNLLEQVTSGFYTLDDARSQIDFTIALSRFPNSGANAPLQRLLDTYRSAVGPDDGDRASYNRHITNLLNDIQDGEISIHDAQRWLESDDFREGL